MPEKPTYEELEQRVRELERTRAGREGAERLQGERAFLSAALDNIEEAIVMCDGEGRLIRFNEAARRLHGLPEQPIPPDQWSGHYDLYRVDGRTPLPVEEIPLFRALQGERVQGAEIAVAPKQGSLRYLVCNGQALTDETGRIIGAAVAMHDITERKKAEEALQESELKYRNLFDNANEAIFVVQDRRLVFLNPKTEELTGYSAEELHARPFIDFVYEEDRERVMNRHISRLKSEEIPHVYSFRVQRKDGSVMWVELNAVLIEWKGKTATLNFFSDVTERKRGEEALRESEQRYRRILESIVDGYYEVDLTGSFTFFNNSVCDLLGYSRDELVGTNYRQYTDERSAEALFQAFNQVFRTGRPTRGFDWEVVRKDGTRRAVEASVTLIQDPEGRPMGFRGIARDISRRKEAEAEKENLREKLQQAQKMESIGTLAGGIAHNFNNVLMGIQGRASLMMMDKDPSSSDYEHLKGIESYVLSATGLTRALLGFARGGKYEVETTDLNALIERENSMFGQTKKEIRIGGAYEPDLWAVEVDQEQMRQVLLNLYVNAWQAMPGGGDIHIRTENVALDENAARASEFEIAPGRYAKVSVTDTGVGMDDATREKIFDPFFSTKENGQGSGLGLASVYGIIKNHGGFIHVQSRKGKGTTFHLYLPASQKGIVGEVQDPGGSEIHYGRGTILLVDDEEMITEVGRGMMERLGYRVLVAGSGREALDLYKKHRTEVDLVVLDMIMPEMGGGETYDRLKEIDPASRVLLSSGYSLDGQAKEILDRGCNGFIQKPFAVNELSRKLISILHQSG